MSFEPVVSLPVFLTVTYFPELLYVVEGTCVNFVMRYFRLSFRCRGNVYDTKLLCILLITEPGEACCYFVQVVE